MPETSSDVVESISPPDLDAQLPLALLRSEIVPPAANAYASSIDWLPDFAGYSWVAYGASTLLVISHLPSPLCHEESQIGPIFRQVFELSSDSSSGVIAVSWSPVVPSVGELAAASGNCIFVFVHDVKISNGSFCWSQNVVLLQSSKVEAIEWTGSGDGIVAGGSEVVLWRRRNCSWEIAWKFKENEPQNMVSATWSVEGPIASATFWDQQKLECKQGSKCVLVFSNDRKLGFHKFELHHPQRLLMIQWRKLNEMHCVSDVKHSPKNILLTCCADGTVRLWSEILDGKIRKAGNEAVEHKMTRPSFCVTAVIEVNQTLNGALGSDISLRWATQAEGILKTREATTDFFSMECYKQGKTGACEWLIGYGPGPLVTFWAIHCLDDSSPLRFPRITLWRRQELQGSRTGIVNSADRFFIAKAIVLRQSFSAPPMACYLIHLLPGNKVVWSLLYSETSSGTQCTLDASGSESLLPSLAQNVKDMSGHSGEILQVASCPCVNDIVLLASLDSNGLVLLWSLSSTSGCALELSTPTSSWKLCGRLEIRHSKCTCIEWACSTAEMEWMLLIGHDSGIDVFLLRIQQSGENGIIYKYVCTLPVMAQTSYENGPIKLIFTPLLFLGEHKLLRFMILAVWLNELHALSWEVIFHSCDDLLSHCKCKFDSNINPRSSGQVFESTFAGKRYLVAVNPSSLAVPATHLFDSVTSFDALCPSWSVLGENISYDVPAYTLATGHSDGTLKLWKHNILQEPMKSIQWELVGRLTLCQGQIHAIAVSDGSKKIAICSENKLNGVNTISIWDTVNLNEQGIFILEHSLAHDGDVVAIKWSALGNGELLLGVCLQNKLQIYAQKRCSNYTLLNSSKFAEAEIWRCIAVSHCFPCIRDFHWGPSSMVIIVHETYFSLCSEWLFLVEERKQPTNHRICIGDGNDPVGKVVEAMDFLVFRDPSLSAMEESPFKYSCPSHLPFPSALENVNTGSVDVLGFWNTLHVAEMLKRPCSFHFPQALLTNIYSGNWKRASASVRHLVGYLTSDAFGENKQGAKLVDVVPGMPLSEYFEECLVNNSQKLNLRWSIGSGLVEMASSVQRGGVRSAYDMESEISSNKHNPSSANNEMTREALQKSCDLGLLTCIEKIQILAICDLLNEVGDTYSNAIYGDLDDPGRRFWVALRFQQLLFVRRWKRSASLAEIVIDSKMIGWALHSDCQETLFSSVLPSDPSWQEMRSVGIGFWYKNVAQLRSRMEKLARKQYLMNKNPKDCALLYIALNRVQVLAGLLKISKDEKDKPLLAFLSRNFQDDKNKGAALKNAYVLMGKHQLEMAIAFFLLGGDMSSAVSVCVKNLCDEQLALVMCRLVQGEDGQLERDLITKHILPSAISKGDNWLASVLEWNLGNYSKSFLTMIGIQGQSSLKTFEYSSNHVAFKDPSIGLYCLMLANRNNMKNAIGEDNAATFSRWAAIMASTAFNRCGLPLEALEYIPASNSEFGKKFQECSTSSISFLFGIPESPANVASNWISSSVASSLDNQSRLEFALQYLSKLLRDHPSWPGAVGRSDGTVSIWKDRDISQYVNLLKNFRKKTHVALDEFEKRFSLPSSLLVSKILATLCRHGLSFIGYSILHEGNSSEFKEDGCHVSGSRINYAIMQSSILKSFEDISVSLFRFATVNGTMCLFSESHEIETDLSPELSSKRLDIARNYAQALLLSFVHLRASVKVWWASYGEDQMKKLTSILDIFEYFVQFAMAWFEGNVGCLCQMLQPVISSDGDDPQVIDASKLSEVLWDIRKESPMKSGARVEFEKSNYLKKNHDANAKDQIPEDEKWHAIGVCAWKQMKNLIENAFLALRNESDVDVESDAVCGNRCLQIVICQGSDHEEESEPSIRLILPFMKILLKAALTQVSSNHVKRLTSLMKRKIRSGFHIPILFWLKDCGYSQATSRSEHANMELMKACDSSEASNVLWNICIDPNILHEGFQQEGINFSSWFYQRPFRDWGDKYHDIEEQNEKYHTGLSDFRSGHTSGSDGVSMPNSQAVFFSKQKDFIRNEVTGFDYPKELCKRNGELVEALCLNSVGPHQAAIASNRKGIIFFNWESGASLADQSHYVWPDADWPHNGWAGSESTPLPTCVSLGIGLGSKKGAHLGLGGATVGMFPLERSKRGMRGAGVPGASGYAGLGASSLGWEIQEDFEQFVDPPPTVETISTRAFSSHPSRPLFLVGSCNTHIYLWEFGKDRAAATYGVLPAANVPPPYALASISAVQFGPCGHRFVSAALDGTLCTWQLEVGGRSNVHPVESSLCFNSHASDVSYITSSGSIVVAAGYSTNGVNVVVWDTLAPPTTSQASIVCHEGGARSVAVFDNDLGSGSVSPLIVSGGKNGDVGLHDFRYIATGKTKRHGHFGYHETTRGMSSTSDMQHTNGMLWYIPKAHLGSVTKVSTIPNTSLFLTGSKDGDVKLWDAKAARLLCHWTKLHERHTFLQPSSRGYGGIIRVTIENVT